MALAISASTNESPFHLTPTSSPITNNARAQTFQKVRQAEAEQQSAVQKTAMARASSQTSQDNLRAAQLKEQQAAEKVNSAQAEYRKSNQPQATQSSGKNINVLA